MEGLDAWQPMQRKPLKEGRVLRTQAIIGRFIVCRADEVPSRAVRSGTLQPPHRPAVQPRRPAVTSELKKVPYFPLKVLLPHSSPSRVPLCPQRNTRKAQSNPNHVFRKKDTTHTQSRRQHGERWPRSVAKPRRLHPRSDGKHLRCVWGDVAVARTARD